MVRVTAAAFIRVFDTDNNVAVLGSLSNYKNYGKCILSPIGGAVEVTDEGRKFLLDHCKVRPEDYENATDLRLHMDPQYLETFKEWFIEGRGHEPHPARREFGEEMGKKEHAILSPQDISRCSFRPHTFQPHKGRSSRRGQEGMETEYFYKIYNGVIPKDVLNKMIAASTQPRCLLRFVTPDDIKNGKVGKCEIIKICGYLLK